jgi:hypothetical protein
MEDINIKELGITKAQALMRLFNASQPLGMGFLQPYQEPMTEEEAERLVERSEPYGCWFDYVRGRVMKVNLSKDTFSPRLYDRDNGEGAALAALTGGT